MRFLDLGFLLFQNARLASPKEPASYFTMVVQAAQEGPSSEAREKLSHDRNGSARTAEAEKVVIGDLDNDISLR